MKHPFLAFVIGTATLLSGAGLYAGSNYATPYTFTTWAGSTTNARLALPRGIAVDRHGNFFVADSGDIIRKIDTNGNVTTIAGFDRGIINGLGGIAVDGKDNLFVVDTLYSIIRKIDMNGNVTTIAGHTVVFGGSYDGQGINATFNNPQGITVDATGNLFVTDNGNNTIRKIDTNGNVTTIAGQTGVTGSSDGQGTNATFNSPSGIAVDATGNLFVADSGNNTVRKVDTNGDVMTIAGQAGVGGSDDGQGTNATFNGPSGIAVDATGNLFVADSGNSTTRKIDGNWNVTTIAGQTGVTGSSDGQGTNATFNSPQGITVDGAGNLLVADTSNNTIRNIDTNGDVTSIAGQAGVGGSDDGNGTNAIFTGPGGISVDVKGNLFVADTLNNIIRKIDTNGNVTTIAGQTGLN